MSLRNYYNGIFVVEKRNNLPPEDGEYSFDSPIHVPCFRRKKTQVLELGLSERVISNVSYATQAIVLAVGDRIDGAEVIAVDEPHGGNLKYWRAYV
jgi:hypothetical protein